MALRGNTSETSASSSSGPPASPSAALPQTVSQQQSHEVISMMRHSSSYDDLTMDVTTDRGIREIFDKMDRDKDGKLSREELETVLLEHNLTTPAEERDRAKDEVTRVLAEVDDDRDGEMSFDEFHKLLREQHVRRAALYIEDGLSARSVHRLGARHLWMHRVYTASRWQSFVLAMCLLHMAVAFFEHPASVAPEHVPRVGKLNALILDHPEFRYVLLAVEAACVSVYLFDAYLYNGFRPRGQTPRRADTTWASGRALAWDIEGQKGRDLWVMTRVVIAVAMAMDIVLAVSGLGLLRFSRPLRPCTSTSNPPAACDV